MSDVNYVGKENKEEKKKVPKIELEANPQTGEGGIKKWERNQWLPWDLGPTPHCALPSTPEKKKKQDKDEQSPSDSFSRI